MNATHRNAALALLLVIVLLALASLACSDLPSCNDQKCWDARGPGCFICEEER